MTNNQTTLAMLDSPEGLRKLPVEALPQLATEIREEIVSITKETGGHLGASLGAVDLILALHYVFNTPKDKLIFDIGHQAYAHKILTGRKEGMRTLRQSQGLSGFLNRQESAYDHFGAGHSSTSLSAGLGFCAARDLRKEKHEVVCVIGDGAMSAGMVYEAINNLGAMQTKMIIVLNDNDMSIAKPTGALRDYLAKLINTELYQKVRGVMEEVADILPPPVKLGAKSMERFAKGVPLQGSWFEDFGVRYVGPVDGHDLAQLIAHLEALKDKDGPMLLHCVTKKGKGYAPAECAKDSFHGVSAQFDVVSTKKTPSETFTEAVTLALVKEAASDEKILAITAAMPDGTGLKKFEDENPTRFYDVGIAEQHAVTFAAGLAACGFKPYVALYSTFLQRAMDQVIHDVAVQSLPVRFLIDRAGYVGQDGPTHDGLFDLVHLASLPGFVVMAPATKEEAVGMVGLMTHLDQGPSAMRYPKGEAWDEHHLCARFQEKTGRKIAPFPEISLGKGHILVAGEGIAILNLGAHLDVVLEVALLLQEQGHAVPTIANARFAKPVDEALVLALYAQHEIFCVVEEGAIGGFFSQVMHLLLERGKPKKKAKLVSIHTPDRFIPHETNSKTQYTHVGMNAASIAHKIIEAMNARENCESDDFAPRM